MQYVEKIHVTADARTQKSRDPYIPVNGARSPIYEGDKYMDTPEGPVCKDCIEGMSVTEFCELIGESFKTAEKEEE